MIFNLQYPRYNCSFWIIHIKVWIKIQSGNFIIYFFFLIAKYFFSKHCNNFFLNTTFSCGVSLTFGILDPFWNLYFLQLTNMWTYSFRIKVFLSCHLHWNIFFWSWIVCSNAIFFPFFFSNHCHWHSCFEFKKMILFF